MKRVALLIVVALASLLYACGEGVGPGGGPIVERVPFANGERLTYALQDDAGALIARGTLTASRSQNMLELKQAYVDANAANRGTPATDTASLSVDAQTLRPLALVREVDGVDEDLSYWATYSEDGRSVVFRDASGEDDRTIRLPEDAYDNESSLWLWRTLPLADDFKREYVSVNAVERSRQSVSVSVTARERIEVPAGVFETWRLQVRNGRATRIAWINVEAPHEVVQWDNGSVVFRLEATR